jgi:hypothetical protein
LRPGWFRSSSIQEMAPERPMSDIGVGNGTTRAEAR